MKKNIALKAFLMLITAFMLLSITSCDNYMSLFPESENYDKVVLLKDNSPTFNLILSDEVMQELQEGSPDLLNSMEKYFNLTLDENVESNIISINAKPAGIFKNVENVSVSDMSFDSEKSDDSEVLYDDLSDISYLRYKDYYIDVSFGKISIICGSVDAAVDALEYINVEYIDNGVTQDGEFLISPPISGIHSGEYLEGSIAGNSLDKYSLVYMSDDLYNDGEENALYLHEYFEKNFGLNLDTDDTDDSQNITNKIVIGKTKLPLCEEYYSDKIDICSYKIMQTEDDLYIFGGSDWSIQYAIDYLIEQYFSKEKDIPKEYCYEGSIYGEYLFEKYEGSNLRLMTNNIWDNVNNNAIWSLQGEDCSIFTRLEGMSKAFMAYNPDVLCLQEMDSNYVNVLINYLNNAERNYKLVSYREAGLAGSTCTPIIYNADEVTLLDSYSHVFTYGSNQLSKSYTWGYFKKNDSDECFVVVSTHLWWMSESSLPGSIEYRECQLTEISEAIDELMEKYDCPCFVLGDFNCNAMSDEYQISSKLDFLDCYDIATEFADDTSGKYSCNSFGFSCKPNGGTYKENAIDHALARNLKDSQVLVYDYVTPNFYGKLSDHAPLYIDVKLN